MSKLKTKGLKFPGTCLKKVLLKIILYALARLGQGLGGRGGVSQDGDLREFKQEVLCIEILALTYTIHMTQSRI